MAAVPEQIDPPTARSLKTTPRYIARRDGKLEPLSNVTTRAEADNRINEEVINGTVQEVDLYVYVGTYRPKKDVEVVDLYAKE